MASAGEQYEAIVENAFLSPLSSPLSTFSIDVDTASYANVRRFLNEGRLPPPSAVRIEELVNYFTYSYPQPKGKEPFSVNMEAAECPWNAGHLLLRVGLKGKEIHRSERPASNLTFLLDVSGSMSDANKLPLLKTTLMMFVAELTENDRVSIVTYAGDAGLRLPPTRGNEKEKIMAAIDSLSAGGSTHGSAGIQLAYEQAGQYFLKEGTNRVILATDGDLNVGVTSDDALVQLIKEKATGGTFLTVLGFGTGNLKDGKLEKLADNGNGVYAYIDGVREGRKVLVEQMSGSLVTIAKDVKIQIEFNPAQIASYRLLGYENRVLAAEDFNNDKKDAGEIGAGHTVTALYELVPVGMKEQPVVVPVGEPLKYQATREGSGFRVQNSDPYPDSQPPTPDSRLTKAAASGELLTLKLRYKEPDGVESRLVEFPLKERGGQFHSASKDLQFAAAVASFGMILRGSEHRGSGNLPAVAEIAGGALGDDPNGYRAEFVDLIRKAQALGAQ
jgi:Ca-activated chloride channel family protein